MVIASSASPVRAKSSPEKTKARQADTVTFAYRVHDVVTDSLKDLAHRRGVSVSDIAREAIFKFLTNLVELPDEALAVRNYPSGKAGRPPEGKTLKPKAKPDRVKASDGGVILGFRIHKEIIRQLTKFAKKRDMTASALARELLYEFLRRRRMLPKDLPVFQEYQPGRKKEIVLGPDGLPRRPGRPPSAAKTKRGRKAPAPKAN